MPDRRPRLIVMVKEPRIGRVKTRLARDIGPVEALRWYRAQLAGLMRRLEDPRWRIVLAVTPDTARAAPRWPVRLPRIAQGAGDIGARMLRALRAEPGPALLIGSDIPGVRRAHIAHAFRLGAAGAVVLGPAEDGGFWLIGARHPRRLPGALFAGVRWSGRWALSDTLARLRGQRLALADRLADVDCAADLAAARRC